MRTVQDRARGMLANGDVRLGEVGPDSATAEVLYRPPRSMRREGWTARTWLVTWTRAAGAWTCECAPRQGGPCPHVLAVRGLLAALEPTHPAVGADPWERVAEG